MIEKIITVSNLHKSFIVGVQEVKVLKDVSFSIEDGDFVVIFGPSGCGKSTLLHSMLGLEAPTSGEVIFSGKNLYKNTTEDDCADFRKKMVGMVFQQSNWIKAFSVKENVAFPLVLLGYEKILATEKALEMLARVGMEKWAENIPMELSAGQQQRVSLARSLIHDPSVIIADEPTGNLDYESGQDMMQLLYDLNKQYKKTIIMVTHDLEYLKFAKSLIKIFNGEIVGIYDSESKDEILKGLNYKRGIIKNN